MQTFIHPVIFFLQQMSVGHFHELSTGPVAEVTRMARRSSWEETDPWTDHLIITNFLLDMKKGSHKISDHLGFRDKSGSLWYRTVTIAQGTFVPIKDRLPFSRYFPSAYQKCTDFVEQNTLLSSAKNCHGKYRHLQIFPLDLSSCAAHNLYSCTRAWFLS